MSKQKQAYRVAAVAKTEQDYLDAIDRVIDIVQMGVQMMPGSRATAAASVVNKLAPIARQAAKLAPVVAPAAQKAAGVVAPAAKAAVDAVENVVPEAGRAAASKVRDAAQGVGAAAANAADDIAGRARALQEARTQARARKVARETILNGAEVSMSVEKLVERWGGEGHSGIAGVDSFLDSCGCYIVAVSSRAVKNSDYTSCSDIYVGKGSSMGDAAYADATGTGNADVYADIKFGRHAYVLFYACNADRLDELAESLVCALDAKRA